MNKKLISLLVAICLVIGLLPVMSIAEESEPTTAKVAIGTTTNVMTVDKGGEAVYGKSVSFAATKNDGTTAATGWEYTTTGASESDWNFKFEYPANGVPTLTLKDAKLINLDEDGKAMKKDGTAISAWTGIQPRNAKHTLKIVLQGENTFKVNNVIRAAGSDSNKFNKVIIVGENGGSLTGEGKTIGIQGRYGVPITIENADITLSTVANSNTATSAAQAAAIYTEDADITIKNSKLTLDSTNDRTAAVNTIHAEGTGAIKVENSELKLTSETGTAFNKAPVLADGWTAKAGDDAVSAATVTSADALLAKYVELSYPAGTPDDTESTESTEDTQAPEAPQPPDDTESTEASEAPENPEDPVLTPTAPAVDTTKPSISGSAESGTVTLWGTEVTVDSTNSAYYWVNGADGANPVATTDTTNWNYSFTLVDGVPTVTLKNATYSGAETLLYAKYDGNLKFVYEGTNNIVVPLNTTSKQYRYFLYYAAATNSAGKGKLYMEGADGAVLNVTGGDNDGAMLTVGNKAYLTVYGGTINMEKGTSLGSNSVISAPYSKTTIQDCTLNVKNVVANNDRHPAVVVGGTSSGKVTITNAKVNIETNAHAGLIAGVFMSNMTSEVNSSTTLTIEGNSNVKVVNTIDSSVTKTLNYSGTGISASTLVIKGGNVEVEGTKKAVHLYTENAVPDLTDYYNNAYEMVTTKGGAPVTEYTATTYLKISYCDHATTDTRADSATGEFVKYCTKCNSELERTPCPHEHKDAPYFDNFDQVTKCLDCGYEDRIECPHATTKTPVLEEYFYVTYCADCQREVTRVECDHATTDAPVLDGYDYVTKCSVCTKEVKREACKHPNIGPVTEGGQTTVKCTDCGCPMSYTLKIDGTSYTLNALDTPVYTVNTTMSGTFGSTTKDYTAQSTTDATETNYNAKLIWHTGDNGPTLYLKDFVLDNYDEELGAWRKGSSSVRTTAGILTDKTVPLKIVVESGACVMQTYEGIHYQNELTMESVGDASLTMYTNYTGIIPTSDGSGYAMNGLLSGNKLTLNVNLDITQTGWPNGSYANVIRTNGADMVIEGGKIVTKHTISGKSARGILVENSGNLIVNGGYVYAETYNADNQNEAAIDVAGDIVINGGTVEASSNLHSGLKATNITLAGGTVKARVADAALLVRSEAGKIYFTGGLLDSLAARPFAYMNGSNQAVKTPELTGTLQGWVGDNPYIVEAFAGEYKKYNKLSYDAVEKNELPDPEPGGEILLGYTLTLPGHSKSVSLEQYDVPVYFKTVYGETAGQYTAKTKKVYDEDGNVVKDENGNDKTEPVDIIYGPAYDVRTTTEDDDWSGMLVWKSTDPGPTLYLDGFVYDDYWEDAPTGANKWRYRTDTNDILYSVAFKTGSSAPLTIVLQGDDSFIQTRFGIHYAESLTIKSEGDTKLTVETQSSGIAPLAGGATSGTQKPVEGIDLNLLNANIDVSFRSYYSGPQSKSVIYAQNGNITIEGSNVKATVNGTSGNIYGISTYGTTGNITIKDSKVETSSTIGYSAQNAAIYCAEKVTLINSDVSVSANSNGVYGMGGVEIDGTTLKIRGGTSGIMTKTGEINFKSGLLDILSGTRPFSVIGTNDKGDITQSKVDPVLNGELQGWVGLNPYVTEPYAGEFKKYIKVSYEPVEENTMPVPVPGGEIPLKTQVSIAGTTYELKKYDEAIYFMNTSKEVEDTAGNKMTRWTQTRDGANEDNWNAKFVWNSTDETATLYLRDFKMDDWNNEVKKMAKNPNSADGAGYATYAITTGSDVPLTIKLIGDNLIETKFGITYYNNLNIVSEDDGKLTINNASSTISPNKSAGYTLTIDANLDLTIRGFYNTEFAAGCILNYQGDIIINGGTIKCTAIDANKKNVNSINARSGGDIIINGGNITGNNAISAGQKNAVIQAGYGKLIINGGVVNANPDYAVGLSAGDLVEINGGEVNIMSPFYAITCGYMENRSLKHNPININGGTVTIMADKSFYSSSKLTIGEGVMAYAGAGKKNAEVVGLDNMSKVIGKPWFFSTDDESKFLVLDEEDEEYDDDSILTAPTSPTTADGTGVATDATGIIDPTGATTPNGQNPDNQNPEGDNPEEEEQYWDSNIFVDYVEGDMDEIPDALIEIGLDNVDAIWELMLENMWYVDETINRVSFFDAVPWFYDGEEWIFADESHLPEDGFVTVTLPYPEGTDMNTEFVALHMFTTDTFGMIPGEIELVYSENTEDGIYLELNGLSPVMLGWTDYSDDGEVEGEAEDDFINDFEGDAGEGEDVNPPTGDTDVAIFFALMLFSALGMAAVVVLNKKRAV